MPDNYGITKTRVSPPRPAPLLTERELLERILSKLSISTSIPSTFNTGQMLVVIAGIAEQLPSRDIPYGYQAVIKALPGNAGIIQIGFDKPSAENIANSYPLAANEGIALNISNLSTVWFTGAIADGVAWIVEQQ